MSTYEFVPAKPTFPVKYSLYMKIIDSIPFGKLSTLDAIDRFLAEVYGVSNVKMQDPQPLVRFHEISAEICHAWWRIVSDKGFILDMSIPIGVETRKQRLEAEGHVVIRAHAGSSYRVENYKDHMFDLNILRPIMPPAGEAIEQSI